MNEDSSNSSPLFFLKEDILTFLHICYLINLIGKCDLCVLVILSKNALSREVKLPLGSTVGQWYVDQRVCLLDNWVIPINFPTASCRGSCFTHLYLISPFSTLWSLGPLRDFSSRRIFFCGCGKQSQSASYKTKMRAGADNIGFLHFSKVVIVLATLHCSYFW